MRLFLTIRKGKLIAEVTTDKRKTRYVYPANKIGAGSLASMIARNQIEDVSYSSSVDFPVDSGAPDLDFRTLIETAHLLILNKQRNKILEAFLSFYRESPLERRWTLVELASQYLSGSEMASCMESARVRHRTSIKKARKP